MDAATWQRAKEWLLEAAALAESERAAYLAARCPDEMVRNELFEMLASDETLSGIVSAATLGPGTRLGPYKIETVIGESENAGFYGAAVTRKGDLIASVGGTALHVQPIRSRARVQVDRGNLASPRWRADECELYYLINGHLMAADISGVDPVVAGPPRKLFEFRGSFFSPSRDRQRFLAAVPQPSGESTAADIIFNSTSLPGK
jgi:hypothetical protein